MPTYFEDASVNWGNGFETRHDTTYDSEASNLGMPGTWYNEDQLS